jgi:hypothetical protein
LLAFAPRRVGRGQLAQRRDARPRGAAALQSQRPAEVKVWADIGLVPDDCHLGRERGRLAWGRLHTEACRMGGDLALQKRPERKRCAPSSAA